MKRGLLLIVGFLFCAFLSAQDLKTIKINGAECANGHIIIKFKNDYSDAGGQNISTLRQNLIGKYRTTVKKQWKMKAELWQIDTLQMPKATQTILDSLKKLPYVQYAEPDFIVKADALPNDPSFNQQWALHNTGQNGGTADADIKAPEAWDITTGDTNIVVGVIDTGIDYLHPDLAANIWTNWDEIPGNGIDDDNNGYIDDVHGWDFYNNDNDPMDDRDHGTHVAGIIGAVGNNGIGVAGVAWKVRLMALKFICSGGVGYVSGAVSALEYANANGAKITNNSWIGGGPSQALNDAVAEADSVGALFIVAAGNDSHDNDLISESPANIDVENVISVASTDNFDHLSDFSNWGLTSVDLAAPGSSIYSTMLGNNYYTMSGTSMATPHVSGVAVMAWAAFPGFSNLEIKHQIFGSLDEIECLGEKTLYGGRLNCYKAVSGNNILPLTVSSKTASFGAEYVNTQSESIQIQVENILSTPVTIDSIAVTNGFLVSNTNTYYRIINNLQITANSVNSINIVFHPDSAKSYQGLCNIYYSGGSSNVKRIKVFLRGLGVSSGTMIPGGPVSGIWSAQNSPYYIKGDLEVIDTNILIIQPGVTVNFSGHYSLTVYEQAELKAVGNQSDSITFTAVDTITGWNGIRILDSRDTDSFIYCNFLYSRKQLNSSYDYKACSGGALLIVELDLLHNSTEIRNCLFSKNRAFIGAAIQFDGLPESKSVKRILKSCKFTGNYGAVSVIYLHGNSEFFAIDCEFNNNSCNISHNGIIDIQPSSSLNNFFYKCKFINTPLKRQIESWNRNVVYSNCLFYNNNTFQIIRGLAGYNAQLVTHEDINTSLFASNCNFIFNNSPFLAAMVGDNKTIQSNIFWNNPVPSNLLFDIDSRAEKASIEYCDIQDGHSGTGNIAIDPLFTDYVNFQLQSSSPCINTGVEADLQCDADGSRNDMGLHGGNGLIVKEKIIDFGIAGVSVVSSPATYTLELTNLRDSTIIFDSLYFQGDEFFIADLTTFPLTLTAYSTLGINLAFSPHSRGLLRDTLSLFSNDMPRYLSRLPVQGTGISGTTLCGNLSDTLKTIYSPYNLTCDSKIAPDDTLVIDPGVVVKVMPDKNLEIGGTIIINGTKDDSVIFTCYNDMEYWGKLLLESSQSQQKGCGIIAKYVVFEKGRGVKIIDNISSEKSFNNCTFRFINDYLGSTTPGIVSLINPHKVSFESCVFHNNSSYYFLFSQSGIFLLRNCLAFNNMGNVFLGSGSLTSINSTFLNNEMIFEVIGSCNFNLINSVIFNNSAIQVETPEMTGSHSLISLEHSDIRNGINGVQIGNPSDSLIWGDGNIDLSPGLYSINGVYYLDSLSPCINAGNSDTTALDLPEIDVYGNIRIWNDTIDIGANEYGAPPFLPGVSGHYYYNNSANTPLDSVSIGLKLNGVKVDSIYSNVAGQYQFLQKGPGNYSLIAQSQKPWNGVNGTDALKVQRHFAGIELLTEPVRLQAADVNASGSINGTDALKIKRRFAGLDATFAAGDWTFAKPTLGGNTVVIQDENVVQNFYGLCVGDVNGSYVPGSGAKSSAVVSLAYKPYIEVHTGQEFLLPVTLDEVLDVSAVSLVLKFPEEKIRIQDVRMQDGPEVVFRQFADEVRMAWSEVKPIELKPGDTLLRIYCKVADELVKDELIYPLINNETELADRLANPISGSTLNINPIRLKTGKLPDNAPNPENGGLQIIPNPNTGRFIIQIDRSYTGIVKITIYDSKGITLIQSQSVKISNGVSSEINFSNQARGLYMIKLKYDNTELKGKMIIR